MPCASPTCSQCLLVETGGRQDSSLHARVIPTPATSRTQATQSGFWVTALYSDNPPTFCPSNRQPLLHSLVLQPGVAVSSGIARPTVCSLRLLLLGSPLGPEVTATAAIPWLRLALLHPAKQKRVTWAFLWFCSALPPPSHSAPTLALAAPTWLVPRWPRPRRQPAPFCSPPRAEPALPCSAASRTLGKS